MATFPITLPRPTHDGYQLEPVDQVIRTDMESGAARVRRRTTARNDQIALTWRFKEAEMATFRNWFDGDAQGGAAWFWLTLADGYGALVSREVRFVGAWQATLAPGKFWDVSGKVEVR